jgi:hypothetical protein
MIRLLLGWLSGALLHQGRLVQLPGASLLRAQWHAPCQGRSKETSMKRLQDTRLRAAKCSTQMSSWGPRHHGWTCWKQRDQTRVSASSCTFAAPNICAQHQVIHSVYTLPLLGRCADVHQRCSYLQEAIGSHSAAALRSKLTVLCTEQRVDFHTYRP